MTIAPLTHAVPSSAVTLMAGVVDYAGLFPPASLDLRQAVAEYATALAGPDAWLLGRFVMPAGRVGEFASVQSRHPTPAAPWRLSALVASAWDADLAAIVAFNRAAGDHAVVDAIECTLSHLDDIDRLAAQAPSACAVFVEIPPGADLAAWITRLAACRLAAKLRTGGVTAAAFPAAGAVVAFMQAALRAGVRFKATAGLHHAVRGDYRLTYDVDPPHATMYGYLNVLLAAAALLANQPAAVAEQVLLRTDVRSLRFADDAVRWDDLEFPVALLHATRDDAFAGFGSCSFREPAQELRSLVASPL